jgi:hypothetical protein
MGVDSTNRIRSKKKNMKALHLNHTGQSMPTPSFDPVMAYRHMSSPPKLASDLSYERAF